MRDRLFDAGRRSVLMTVAAMGASFLAQVALARRFGPSGLGLHSATALFVIVVATLVPFGLAVVISRRVSAASGDPDRERWEIETALGAIVVFALVSSVIAGIAWPAVTGAFGLSQAAAAEIVAAATGAAVCLSGVSAILLGRLAMTAVTGLVVVQPAAVLLGLALPRAGITLTPSELAATGFVAAGSVGLAAALMRHRPALAPRRWLPLLRAAPNGGSVLYATLLSSWIDRGIVAAIAGPAALGAFAAASTLSEAALRVPRNLTTFAVPAYARLAGDRTGTMRVLTSHVRLLIVFFLAAGAPLIAAGDEILTFLFGPGFQPAATTTRLLAIALVPAGIALALSGSHAGADRTAPRFHLVAVAQVTLGVVATSRFSISGAAFAHVVSWLLTAFVQARSETETSFAGLRRLLGRAALVCAAVWIACWSSAEVPIWWPAHALTAAILALAVGATVILEDSDRRLLLGLMRRNDARM